MLSDICGMLTAGVYGDYRKMPRLSQVTPRIIGGVLLAFAAFILILGLNTGETFWLAAATLLLCGAVALILIRPWSRRVLLLTALSAAVVGLVGQVNQALQTDTSVVGAGVVWLLWSAIWLITAFMGGRYLPERRAGD